jgi:hypothetical protein
MNRHGQAAGLADPSWLPTALASRSSAEVLEPALRPTHNGNTLRLVIRFDASARAGRWHANVKAHSDWLICAEGESMAEDIKHYSKMLRRKGIEGSTNRHLVVKETAGGVVVDSFDIRPSEAKKGFAPGYEWHRVSMDWFATVDEALKSAEAAFHSNLNEGFYEVVADKPANN